MTAQTKEKSIRGGATIVEALVRSLGGKLDQHFGPQGSHVSFDFFYRPLNETSCIDVE
jgi:hypothetical protein